MPNEWYSQNLNVFFECLNWIYSFLLSYFPKGIGRAKLLTVEPLATSGTPEPSSVTQHGLDRLRFPITYSAGLRNLAHEAQKCAGNTCALTVRKCLLPSLFQTLQVRMSETCKNF